MSIYNDIMPWREPSAKEIELDERRKARVEAKEKAKEAYDLSAPAVVKFLWDVMNDDAQDIQARLRAAEMLASRQIPKVASEKIEETGKAIETADVAALRESILNEFKKGQR